MSSELDSYASKSIIVKETPELKEKVVELAKGTLMNYG